MVDTGSYVLDSRSSFNMMMGPFRMDAIALVKYSSKLKPYVEGYTTLYSGVGTLVVLPTYTDVFALSLHP